MNLETTLARLDDLKAASEDATLAKLLDCVILNVRSMTTPRQGYDPDTRFLYGPLGLHRTTPRTHDLLMRLLQSVNKVVSKDALISALWPNPDDEPDSAESSLKVCIHWTRKFIAQTGAPFTLKSIWGAGYTLITHPAHITVVPSPSIVVSL